jgi:hypothetical protein
MAVEALLQVLGLVYTDMLQERLLTELVVILKIIIHMPELVDNGMVLVMVFYPMEQKVPL